jgi:MoaA/NifB/PqqE/SkfB family radical SAM enzyme
MPRNPVQILLQVPGFAATLRRKPLLIGAVARHRVLSRRRRRTGRPVLAAMEYAVTYACQAKCAHCSAEGLADAKRERSRLDGSEIDELARQAWRLGVYEVNFTGGEPTLRPDLEDIIERFKPRRTFVGVNTNGERLDTARVRSLRDAGVDLLKLSLDSPDAGVHDANRGLPGSYLKVLETLQLLRGEPGIRGHVCGVATRELIHDGGIERLIRLARGLDATIGFTLPAAVGRWSHRYELLLSPEDLAELRLLARRPGVFFQGSVGLAGFRCPAGRTEVYVSPWGDVLPCPYLQRSFGNIRAQGLGGSCASMKQALTLAGDDSLCLAAEGIRWMKRNVPESRERIPLPGCETEHRGGFCRRPTAPG